MKKIIKKFLKKMNVFDLLQYAHIYIKYMYKKIFVNAISSKEKCIQKRFRKKLGYEIDFSKKPKTFNQKIQFRKLYDDNPLYSICADKYRVREYVKEKIGEEYLIPLYLVTDELTLSQWNELPDSFVAKANHNSGPVQIVKNKNATNPEKVINELRRQLRIDYGVLTSERYYSRIPKKIIVEKFLKDDIEDYKFHCFKNKIFLERITREGLGSMYDVDKWENLQFSIGYEVDSHLYNKPKNFEKMVILARKLSEDFDYVRVDFYNIDGKIYAGELTFCDSSGFGKFTDEKWDYEFGEYWS